MSQNKTKIYCLFAVSLILMIFGALSVTIAFGSEFEADIGHFVRDTVFAPVMYGCLAGGAVCGIAAWVLFARRTAGDEAAIGTPSILHTLLCAVCAIAVFAGAVSDLVAYYFSIGGANTASVGAYSSYLFTLVDVPTAVHYLLWIFGLLGGACMLVSAMPKRYNSAQRALAGFAVPLFMAVKVLRLYFDGSVAINSPAKLVLMLAFISLMLVLTAEVGVTVGRENIFSRYLAMLCVSTVVGGAVGLGMLFVIAGGGVFLGGDIFDALLIIVFAARSAAKLFVLRDARIMYAEKNEKE